MDVENLIEMYSELLQRVILVVEGVAQASNCDSVALLLDHPRLLGVLNPLAPFQLLEYQWLEGKQTSSDQTRRFRQFYD